MDQPDTLATEIGPRTLWHTSLLCSSAIGSILFSIVYFIFGLIAPNYEIFRQPIGDLQLLPQGWVQSTNFFVFGLSICIFALGLSKEMVNGFGAFLIPLFHAVTGLGVILLGIFMQEPAHAIITIFIFITIQISFLLLARRFIADPRWKGWATYTILSVVLMSMLLAIFVHARGVNAPFTGVFERMIVITRLVWTIAFTIRLLEGRRLGPLEKINS